MYVLQSTKVLKSNFPQYGQMKSRDGKWEESERRRVEERRSEKRKSQRKKMQMCEKVGKMRNAVFFRWFVAPEGRKVGSLKRRVRSHLARWEMKTCTPLWREALFQAKMYKTPHVRTTFGSWDVEKVHAVVARSTFRSQNVQSTPCSDHFWKLRCRKSARRCGTKHISKSKCTRHTLFSDHFWKLRCRKSAHRCGAKHISKSKCTKQSTPCADHFWKLRCQKVHAVVARSTFRSQNVKNTRGSDHFLTFRCRFPCAWQAQGIVHLLKSGQNVMVL